MIGDSTPADGNSRGFVYDLRTRSAAARWWAARGHPATRTRTHAYAYDARTGLMTELESPVGPDGTSTAAGTSQNRYVAGTWDYPDTPFEGGHAYVYDLRTRAWTELSAYDNGVSSKVTSITGHTVVGTFQRKPDGSSDQPAARGFAYDIRTGVWSDLGPEMSNRPVVTRHTVLATTRPGAYAYDLRTKTLSTFGPGRTYINGVAGKFASGDTNPGPFGYVYRVDTGEFTLLPAVGGVHSTASDVDRRGAAVGNSATASADPSTPDGVYHATLGPSGAADTGRDGVLTPRQQVSPDPPSCSARTRSPVPRAGAPWQTYSRGRGTFAATPRLSVFDQAATATAPVRRACS